MLTYSSLVVTSGLTSASSDWRQLTSVLRSSDETDETVGSITRLRFVRFTSNFVHLPPRKPLKNRVCHAFNFLEIFNPKILSDEKPDEIQRKWSIIRVYKVAAERMVREEIVFGHDKCLYMWEYVEHRRKDFLSSKEQKVTWDSQTRICEPDRHSTQTRKVLMMQMMMTLILTSTMRVKTLSVYTCILSAHILGIYRVCKYESMQSTQALDIYLNIQVLGT